MDGTKRPARWAGWLLLPAALVLRQVAFAAPELVEQQYSQRLYPLVVALLSLPGRLAPFSVAEVVGLLLLGGAAARGCQRLRSRWRRGALWPTREEGIAALYLTWVGAGVVLAIFLLAWGLNYARPTLAQRLGLEEAAVRSTEVLELGRELAQEATRLHSQLSDDAGRPTVLPFSFRELDGLVQAGIRDLALPGDRVGDRLAPAKSLYVSGLLSYLGISGIYLPFTAEPSVNRQVPDASLPVVVAHEKAHQRGVTDEGEANLVGVLACLGSESPYLRYAGALTAASQLIGSAARYLPEEAASAWETLGPGPRTDLRAIREFWDAHDGFATEVAGRVNDAYLRGNRVEGGVESYGRVVTLLVALHRSGRAVY